MSDITEDVTIEADEYQIDDLNEILDECDNSIDLDSDSELKTNCNHQNDSNNCNFENESESFTSQSLVEKIQYDYQDVMNKSGDLTESMKYFVETLTKFEEAVKSSFDQKSIEETYNILEKKDYSEEILHIITTVHNFCDKVPNLFEQFYKSLSQLFQKTTQIANFVANMKRKIYQSDVSSQFIDQHTLKNFQLSDECIKCHITHIRRLYDSIHEKMVSNLVGKRRVPLSNMLPSEPYIKYLIENLKLERDDMKENNIVLKHFVSQQQDLIVALTEQLQSLSVTSDRITSYSLGIESMKIKDIFEKYQSLCSRYAKEMSYGVDTIKNMVEQATNQMDTILKDKTITDAICNNHHQAGSNNQNQSNEHSTTVKSCNGDGESENYKNISDHHNLTDKDLSTLGQISDEMYSCIFQLKGMMVSKENTQNCDLLQNVINILDSNRDKVVALIINNSAPGSEI